MLPILYENMGLSNTELAFYTSWLSLPWAIKPLWSPLVDSLKTKRWWILVMQFLVGLSLAAVALTLQTDMWLKLTLAFFWLMAFTSATHDIAADGFYILGLSEQDQDFFVGWRSTFYKVGNIFCQSVLISLVGVLDKYYPTTVSWTITLGLLGALMIALMAWHKAILPMEKVKTLPSMEQLQEVGAQVSKTLTEKLRLVFDSFGETLRVFFSKKGVVPALFFMLLFRFPEAQLGIISKPFMLDSMENGGLAMTKTVIGMTSGIGLFSLLLGGIVASWLISKYGIRKCWWSMIAAISLPDAVYIYMAMAQPTNFLVINSCVALEQFGYGLGFTAYTLFLVHFSKGERSTSVFSICTGLQALGMILPGMIAGYLADSWGYATFFWWVMLCCLVTVVVSALVRPKE
jgi:PAT family beta-lactamase induction signal transducer AmpG